MQIAMIVLMGFFVVILFLFIIFLMLSSKQEKNLKTIDKDGKIKKEEIKMEEDIAAKTTTKKGKSDTNVQNNQYKREDVFKLMEFDRILDDMIVQKGGSRFTMAIQCKGINYDLMSEVEQLSVEEGFITFLNTLKYPIQLYVQAQNIDLKSAIDKYVENVKPLKEKYEQVNNEYVKIVSAFDADERKVDSITKERDSVSNIYEYANDIIKYVEKMSLNKNLLQRKFYVLVSYNTSEIVAIDKFNKDEIIEMCSTELITRCRGIISALSSCSVSGRILNSNELADLLYSAYNRDDKGFMSVKEAIDSGFYRLYSVSEDAFTKKELALEEYLKNESKIKALQAMKYVIEKGTIETPASEALEQEQETSRRATNLVKNSNYDPQFENAVNKKILNDFKETKKELSKVDEEQKEEIKKQYEQELEEAKNIILEKPEGVALIEKAEQYAKERSIYNEKNKVDINENKTSDTEKKDIQKSSNVNNSGSLNSDIVEKNEINNSQSDNTTNIYSNSEDDEDESIV